MYCCPSQVRPSSTTYQRGMSSRATDGGREWGWGLEREGSTSPAGKGVSLRPACTRRHVVVAPPSVSICWLILCSSVRRTKREKPTNTPRRSLTRTMSLCHATRTGTMLTHHRHRPSSKARQFLLFSCLLLLLLHFLTSAITTVHCKSCFAQLSANDLFLNSLRFSTGLSSKFTNGYFAMDRGSDIEFVQPTSTSTSTSVE